MTTSEDYALARKLAREIAATFGAPKLYSDLKRERDISRATLDTDPVIERSRRIVEARDEHFGHGLRHLQQVAVDAGAVVQAESSRMGASPKQTERTVFLVLLAAMLHDVKRRVPDHANRSAQEADEILADFPLDTIERQWVVQSIRNHEAFTEPTSIDSPEGQLLSDALYDADKFRWGPDNFTDTVWEMVSSKDVPIRMLLAHFPKGMEGVKKIATTFRSQTGMKYGPEFIDIGLAIGMKLYEELIERFPPDGE
jgi:hypothetical protein